MAVLFLFLVSISSPVVYAETSASSTSSVAREISLQSSAQRSVETVAVPDVPLKKPISHDSSVIQVNAGSGMKSLESALNEVGVEVKNLEKSQDPSIERRLDPWWLKPDFSNRWIAQTRYDLSLDQKLKARLIGQAFGQKLVLEGGYFRDHRPILYIDNQNAPYADVGSTLGRFPNQKDSSFVKAAVSGGGEVQWESVADYDQRDEGVYNGGIWIGRRNLSQASVAAKINAGWIQIRPFVQTRQSEFVSAIAPLTDNSTVGFRTGIQTDWRLSDHASIQLNAARDLLDRTLKDKSVAHFGRSSGRIHSKIDQMGTSFFEWSAHLSLEGAHDGIPSTLSVNQTAWDGGVELSTPKKHSYGWLARVRRFAVLPSPLQRFGDGATLQPAYQLPPETGIRSSTGPWYKTGSFSGQVSAFAEESSNAPILFTQSPGAIETFPLAGLWARGIELNGSLNLSPFTFQSTLVFQEALNMGNLDWQRGHAVPGYPSWITKNELQYKKGHIVSGIRHRYRSTEALDLNGQWSRPPYFIWDGWLGYSEKKWEARLVLNNLFPNYNLPQNLQFPGSASSNILEPTIQQREVRLVCEIAL